MPLRHGPPALVEVRREGGRTTAVVHASVRPIVKVALAAWLGAWAGGELLAVRFATAAADSVLPLFHAFALLFLAGWTFMGLLVGYALLWCHEGTEELSSDGSELTYRRQVRGLGRTRRFRLAEVTGPNIRYDRPVPSIAEVPRDELVRLSFDTGWFTYRLAASVRHADALRVLAALRPGLPGLAGAERRTGGLERGRAGRVPPRPRG